MGKPSKKSAKVSPEEPTDAGDKAKGMGRKRRSSLARTISHIVLKRDQFQEGIQKWKDSHVKTHTAIVVAMSLFTAALFYVDVSTDLIVTLSLREHHVWWFSLMLAFIIIPMLVTSWGVAKYRIHTGHHTFLLGCGPLQWHEHRCKFDEKAGKKGKWVKFTYDYKSFHENKTRTKTVRGQKVPMRIWKGSGVWREHVPTAAKIEAVLLLPLYLIAPFFLDISMFTIPVLRLAHCTHFSESQKAFIISYHAMRCVTEAFLESGPQLLIQGYILLRCKGTFGEPPAQCDDFVSEEGTDFILRSVIVSGAEVLMHVIEIWWMSRCLGVTMKEYVSTMMKIGGGLPIKAIQNNEICSAELEIKFPLDTSQVKQLSTALKTNTSLNGGLDLSDTNWTVSGAKFFAEALCVNKELKTVCMSKHAGTTPTELIIADLKGDSKRKTIDISNRGLNMGAAIVIAELMKTNKSCEKLNLQNNKIGPDGAKAIAELLKKNKKPVEIRRNTFFRSNALHCTQLHVRPGASFLLSCSTIP